MLYFSYSLADNPRKAMQDAPTRPQWLDEKFYPFQRRWRRETYPPVGDWKTPSQAVVSALSSS